LSMEPVVCKPDEPYALTDADLPVLLDQYEILAKEMIRRRRAGNGFTFYHYMIDLKAGPCIYKRISGCGSGTEYMAVTPAGELYPCHQFVGDKKYLMGNVWDGVTNTAIRDEFAKCNVYAREECKDCWARLYCSGGCAANSYHATGSITGIYKYGCELFRKRMECAIMMEVAKSEEEENG
ncbi:MAG: SPASM domain-containing protein, partial [Clostridia bacterium]|nr:SPASM domain-containing protein [Clostridia bacterium]